MRKLYNLFLCASSLMLVACQDDQAEALTQITPNFTVQVGEEGKAFVNQDDALNTIPYGTTLQFKDLSKGNPQKVKWIISNEAFSKEITSENGKAYYRIMVAGKYDIEMIADQSTLAYKNYLAVDGAGVPVPEEVFPSYDLTFSDGTVLEDIQQDAEMSGKMVELMTGDSLIFTDQSVGNPSVMKWSITSPDAGVKDQIIVNDIPYGSHAPAQSYVIRKAGKYNITQSAGGKDVISSDLFSAQENLFFTVGYDPSFEKGDAAGQWTKLWWFGTPTSTVANSTEMAHRGTHSTYFDIHTKPAGDGAVALTYQVDAANVNFPVKSGVTYDISFWLYVKSRGSVNQQIDFNLNHSALYGGISALVLNETTLLNEWVKHTVKVKSNSDDPTHILMRVINNQAGQDANLQFYMDDLTMTEAAPEPTPEPEPVVLSMGATSPEGALILANDALNEVSVGTKVVFKDSSTGSPKNVTWTLTSVPPGMTFDLIPNTTGKATFKFAYEGTYSLTMKADGANELTYTNLIKVVNKGVTPEEPENPVVIPEGDVLSVAGYDYSFEEESVKGFWKNIGETWGAAGAGFKEFTIENTTAKRHSGARSILFSVEAGKKMLTSFRKPSSDIINLGIKDQETYIISFWAYLQAMPSSINPTVRFTFSSPNADILNWNANAYTFKAEDLNQWRKISLEVTCDYKGNDISVTELLLIGSGEKGDLPFEFYLDDISMVKK